MRHRVQKGVLGRNTAHRRAVLRNLVTSFLEKERMTTTLAKAKAARPVAEKMITLGLKGDLHAKRLAFSYLSNRMSLAKLFGEIAPRFSGRNGGYLRIVQTRTRVNDSAPMAVLEFIDFEEKRETASSAKKKTGKKEAEKASS